MQNQFINIGDQVNKPSANRLFLNSTNLLNEVATASAEFTAAWITDVHCMYTGTTKGDYCATRLPQFIDSINGYEFDYLIDSGDSLQGMTSGLIYGNFAQQAAVYATIQSAIAQPKINCLGNHDIYTGFVVADVMTALGMPSRYFYQDIAGTSWRIIVLYSFGLSGTDSPFGPYGLGATQLAWLSSLLNNSASKNVCIISHVPIMSISAMMWYIYNYHINPVTNTVWDVTKDQQVDAYALMELFRLNPCVKVCLNGHEHIYNNVFYDAFGTRFLDGGAGCANYWNPEDHWFYNYAGWNKLLFYADGNVTVERIYY